MLFFVKYLKKVLSGGSLNSRIPKVLLLAVLLNVVFGSLFYFAERDLQPGLSYVDSLWWAMVTMTTVGYGDFFAKSSLGRFLISYPTMIIGIGIIGYLVGVVADAMLDYGAKKRKGLLKLDLKNHLILCHYPGEQKVIRVQDEIRRSPRYSETEMVLVSDLLDELPESLKKRIHFVKGDPAREVILNNANFDQAIGAFILAQNPGEPQSDIKSFAVATQIKMLSREVNPRLRVIVEMVSAENRAMMARSHVDGVVCADGIMDALIAQEFLYPGLNDVFHEVLSNATGSEFYILENPFGDTSFGLIQKETLDSPQNVQVVGIQRKKHTLMNPDKTTMVHNDDHLIVLANNRDDFNYFAHGKSEASLK